MEDKLNKSLKQMGIAQIAYWVITLLSACWLFFTCRKGASSAQGYMGLSFLFWILSVAASGYLLFVSLRIKKQFQEVAIKGGNWLFWAAIVSIVISLISGTTFGGNLSFAMLIGGVDNFMGSLSGFLMFLFTLVPIFTFIGINSASISNSHERHYWSGFRKLTLPLLVSIILSVYISPLMMTIINANVENIEDPTAINIIAFVLWAGLILWVSLNWLKANEGQIRQFQDSQYTPVNNFFKSILEKTGLGYTALWGAILLTVFVLTFISKDYDNIGVFFIIICYIIFIVSLAILSFTFYYAYKLTSLLKRANVKNSFIVLGGVCVLALTSLLNLYSVIGFNPLCFRSESSVSVENAEYNPNIPQYGKEFSMSYEAVNSVPVFDEQGNIVNASGDLNVSDNTVAVHRSSLSFLACVSIGACFIFFLFPICIVAMTYSLKRIMPQMRQSYIGAWILLGASIIFSPFLIVISGNFVYFFIGLIAYGIGLYYFYQSWGKVTEIDSAHEILDEELDIDYLAQIKGKLSSLSNLSVFKEKESSQDHTSQDHTSQDNTTEENEDKINEDTINEDTKYEEVSSEESEEDFVSQESRLSFLKNFNWNKHKWIILGCLIVIAIIELTWLIFRDSPNNEEKVVTVKVVKVDTLRNSKEDIIEEPKIEEENKAKVKPVTINKDSLESVRIAKGKIPSFTDLIINDYQPIFESLGYDVVAHQVYIDYYDDYGTNITATYHPTDYIFFEFKGEWYGHMEFTIKGVPEARDKFYKEAKAWIDEQKKQNPMDPWIESYTVKKSGDKIIIDLPGD